MAMSKADILNEAAECIERDAKCLFESHRTPSTDTIDDPKVLNQWRRELWLASKLRQYAKHAEQGTERQ